MSKQTEAAVCSTQQAIDELCDLFAEAESASANRAPVSRKDFGRPLSANVLSAKRATSLTYWRLLFLWVNRQLRDVDLADDPGNPRPLDRLDPTAHRAIGLEVLKIVQDLWDAGGMEPTVAAAACNALIASDPDLFAPVGIAPSPAPMVQPDGELSLFDLPSAA